MHKEALRHAKQITLVSVQQFQEKVQIHMKYTT